MRIILIITLVISMIACNEKVDNLPELRADAGPEYLDVENDGYSVSLSAQALKDGQVGEWYIISGEHGQLEDYTAHDTKLTGEPGQMYVLRWIVSRGDELDEASTSVSFKEMTPEVYMPVQEEYDNMYLQLYGKMPPYDGTCKWEIVSGLNGQINNPSSHNNATLWGEPGDTYTISFSHIYGKGAIETVEYEITLGDFHADAGNDSIYVPSTSESGALKNITLWASLPYGAQGKWRIIDGEDGKIYDDTLPNSIFKGYPDRDYTLEWTVDYQEYSDKDTLVFSIGDRWGMFTDPMDGNQYRTIVYNDLEWFVDNYNRTSIENGVEVDNWYYGIYANSTIEEGEAVDTDEERKLYGKLYTLESAQLLAPDGWRLPTLDEFNDLLVLFGGQEFAGDDLRVGGSSSLEFTLGGYFNTPYVAFWPAFAGQNVLGAYWVDGIVDESISYVDHFEIFAPVVDEDGVIDPGSNRTVAITAVRPYYGLSVRYVRNVNQ